MSCIVYQVNKKTGIKYAYESVSYWDKDKQQPRSKRKYLGRVDLETAPIIRRIIEIVLDGFGNMKICKTLMEERIPITRMQMGTDCDVNYYKTSAFKQTNIFP